MDKRKEKEIYGVIYALFDPREGLNNIRYIGQTTNSVEQRLSSHLSASNLKKRYRSCKWLKSLVKEGIKPSYLILDQAYSKKELDTKEIFYIKYFRENNHNLTNMSAGGQFSRKRKFKRKKS
jgi:GIY-YIG catalytic domain-containing protein